MKPYVITKYDCLNLYKLYKVLQLFSKITSVVTKFCEVYYNLYATRFLQIPIGHPPSTPEHPQKLCKTKAGPSFREDISVC